MNIFRKSLMVIVNLFFLLAYTNAVLGQAIKLCPEDGAAGDQFGVYVSVSGNYALIGASAAKVADKVSGAAYIFKNEGGEWVQQAKFTPDIPDDDDLFGKLLSLDGDYALVTSYNDDDIAENAGAAYIYKREGEQWTRQTKLYANDAAAFDAFGVAADIHGNRALVGAFSDDDNGFFSGSAYVFLRVGDQWIQEAKLLASDGEAFDKFGRSVALSDDYAVVCGVLDDDNGEESGSVYIFKKTGTTWTEEAKLLPDDGNTGDRFGRSVSIAGDYVAISAAMKDEHGLDSGSSYIFKRIDGQWLQQTKLVPSDLGVGDLMGYCLTNSEDFMAISAHLNDEQGADAGAFYLFHRNENQWSQAAKIMADTPGDLQYFGICVDISDGKLICGAPNDQNDEGVECGTACIYDLQNFVNTSDIHSAVVSIFPNPVNHFLNIKVIEDLTGKKITIYNSTGQQVLQSTMTGQSINISALISGNYFFKLETKEGLKNGKFVVD